MSSREIASKSETHLHDIASSDARRTQGFPGVAREEVGELSLVLLLAARGFVALARLEVRAGAQRGDPPQLRGQSGVELRSWRKAGSRVSVALSDAERDRPRARFPRGEHRHRGSVTKRKRDERDVARARPVRPRAGVSRRGFGSSTTHLAHLDRRCFFPVRCGAHAPPRVRREPRATAFSRAVAVSPECVGWYRWKNARFFETAAECRFQMFVERIICGKKNVPREFRVEPGIDRRREDVFDERADTGSDPLAVVRRHRACRQSVDLSKGQKSSALVG